MRIRWQYQYQYSKNYEISKEKGTRLLLILSETLVSLIRIIMELYSPCRRVRVFFGQGEMAFINFFSKNLFSCNFYIFLSETLVSLIRIIMELYSPCRRVADRNIFVNSLGSLTKIIASVELRVRTQTFFSANKKGSPKGALFIGGGNDPFCQLFSVFAELVSARV